MIYIFTYKSYHLFFMLNMKLMNSITFRVIKNKVQEIKTNLIICLQLMHLKIFVLTEKSQMTKLFKINVISILRKIQIFTHCIIDSPLQFLCPLFSLVVNTENRVLYILKIKYVLCIVNYEIKICVVYIFVYIYDQFFALKNHFITPSTRL